MKQPIHHKEYNQKNWKKGMDEETALRDAKIHADKYKEISGFNFNRKTKKTLFLKWIVKDRWNSRDDANRYRWQSLYIKKSAKSGKFVYG